MDGLRAWKARPLFIEPGLGVLELKGPLFFPVHDVGREFFVRAFRRGILSIAKAGLIAARAGLCGKIFTLDGIGKIGERVLLASFLAGSVRSRF